MRGRALVLGLALSALLLGGEARAQCTISATSLAFGSYDVFSATPLDATGTVTVRCTYVLRLVDVTLSQGSSGTYSPRTMRRGGDILTYNIFRNAARTDIWGNGTGGTSYYSGYIWWFQTLTLTMHGRIPSGQDVRAGTYTDTVTAIVNF